MLFPKVDQPNAAKGAGNYSQPETSLFLKKIFLQIGRFLAKDVTEDELQSAADKALQEESYDF